MSMPVVSSLARAGVGVLTGVTMGLGADAAVGWTVEAPPGRAVLIAAAVGKSEIDVAGPGVVVSTITCVLAGVEVAGGPLSQADIKVAVNTHNRATR